VNHMRGEIRRDIGLQQRFEHLASEAYSEIMSDAVNLILVEAASCLGARPVG
jgi:hypothetical protein